MNDSQFHQLVDQLYQNIEESIDNFNGNSDIDYETNAGLMTLTFDNKSKIIINRQESIHQVWLASKTAGYHFSYNSGCWLCDRSGCNFFELLSHACSQQTNEEVTISEVNDRS